MSTHRLQGKAIPVHGANAVEHAYVECSCGKAWGCWGRSAGGRKLIEANGDCPKADCLSEPLGRADIIYARNGVCHQAANRILWASDGKSTVEDAGGYAFSVQVYGVYGRGPWPRREHCMGGMPPDDRNDSPPESSLSFVDDGTADAFIEQVKKRVNDLSSEEESKLRDVERNLRNSRALLLNRLENGRIGEEEFIILLRSTLKDAMAKNLRALGEKRAVLAFGPAAAAPESLVDPTSAEIDFEKFRDIAEGRRSDRKSAG